jgi:hypothetical protein
MMTKKLAVGAVAAGMLALPAAAVADSAVVGATALVGPTNQTALAQPSGLGPIATPLGACATHLRWVKPLGPAGGHYVGTCLPHPHWVPARGPAGGHYDYAASSCVRWVGPRGPAGGHYVNTCPPQPRWVPARGPAGGHYDYDAGASAIKSSTRPTAQPAQASGAPSWGLDWGSAGIGAATVLGALAIALAAITGLRRRRIARPPALSTH